MGAAVKAHRQRLGVTQEELAWRADMHRTYIADIERGVRNITLRSMVNLAAALQVSVAALLAEPGDLTILAPAPAAVLLIEHDTAAAAQVVRVFREAHLANPVTVIGDGRAALDYLVKRARPQLIMLDLGLPQFRGTELLRRLKAEEATKSIPVVVLTSVRDEKLLLEAARLGAEQHLLKPVEFVQFSRMIPKLKLHWAVVPHTQANGAGDGVAAGNAT